jgi:hypothetical protein
MYDEYRQVYKLVTTYTTAIGEGCTNDADNSSLQSRVRAAYHGENMISLEGIIIVVAWCISLSVAIFVVPKLAAARACVNFGLKKVSQDGVTFFTPVGLDGEPFKIPVGETTDKEGNVVVVMGYAPLAYAMPWLAAEMVGQKVHLMSQSAKGKIAKQLNMAGLLGDADFNPATIAAIELLPRKYQGIALMLSKYLGKGGTTEGGAVQSSKRVESGFKPGI